MSTQKRTFTMPIMVVEGAESNDGRTINPGCLVWNPPPMPVMALLSSPHGQAPPSLVGRLDSIKRVSLAGQIDTLTGKPFEPEVTGLRGRGVFTDSAAALMAIERVEAKTLTGVGAEVCDITDTTELAGSDLHMTIAGGRLMGVCLVERSAFENTSIELDPVVKP